MIQLWPAGISCSSASITGILSWHPWGCVGVQPQLMLSLTANQISQKIVFPLPEIARGAKWPEERNNCSPPSSISVWSRKQPGVGVPECGVGISFKGDLGQWKWLQAEPDEQSEAEKSFPITEGHQAPPGAVTALSCAKYKDCVPLTRSCDRNESLPGGCIKIYPLDMLKYIN